MPAPWCNVKCCELSSCNALFSCDCNGWHGEKTVFCQSHCNISWVQQSSCRWRISMPIFICSHYAEQESLKTYSAVCLIYLVLLCSFSIKKINKHCVEDWKRTWIIVQAIEHPYVSFRKEEQDHRLLSCRYNPFRIIHNTSYHAWMKNNITLTQANKSVQLMKNNKCYAAASHWAPTTVAKDYHAADEVGVGGGGGCSR